MKNIVLLGLLMIPVIGVSQSIFPITWNANAVQTSSDTYDIILTCKMDSGYIIYEPNRADVCMFSPQISFNRPLGWKMLERLELISFGSRHGRMRCASLQEIMLCDLDYYQDSTVYIMSVRKEKPGNNVYVHGKVKYHAIKADNSSSPIPIEVEFKIPLISDKID